MTDKQFNKTVNQIVNAAAILELKAVTKKEVINRYNTILTEQGMEKAEIALQNTLKVFKERAKEYKKRR
ncbi:MAG: hypothetical protein WC123_06920 [Bacilli bacterium]